MVFSALIFSLITICSLGCTSIIGRTAAADTTAVSTTAAESIAVAKSGERIGRDCFRHGYCHLGCCLCDPSVGSKLGAEPVSFSSTPSFSCGYLNRACFCIRG